MLKPKLVTVALIASVLGYLELPAGAHEHSLHKFNESRRAALARAGHLTGAQAGECKDQPTCQLTIDLIDGSTKESIAGLIRIINLDSGKALKLSGQFHRNMNWYALAKKVTLTVPQTKLRVEAFAGIETEKVSREIDSAGLAEAVVKLSLRRIYDPKAKGLYNGNTHLHLRNQSYNDALRYLRVVSQADGLDLVFLSHLRRLPDERNYISNKIVENSLTGDVLRKLSQDGVLFSNGEEHRHNFGPGGQGYGHVMLLDLKKLIRPVSIGPGIMGGKGTDGIPLQRGIKEARSDGATVIWCHNGFGFEGVPNWMGGVLDAQNIFDGGSDGSYKDTFYRYLNLGMHVPFSTGTDWFIYDFSRVYVPVEGKLTSKKWLAALRAGKSYITNGPFLEFSINDRPIGDTIRLSAGSELKILGRALGRNDFGSLELVHNAKVIHVIKSEPTAGHFRAKIDLTLKIDEPGWLALRTALEGGRNEFGKRLFGHTSPVYVEVAGKRIFRPEVARQLIEEIESNIKEINTKGRFANETERNAVLEVYQAGIGALQKRLTER